MGIRRSEELEILLEIAVQSGPPLAACTFVQRVEVILALGPPIGVYSDVTG
jgi:hypothetical protein